jgi:hypothetical protein
LVDETNSEPPKIKVVDRRKFTSKGDPLDSPAAAAKAAAPASPTEDLMAESEVQVPKTAPETAVPSHRGQTSQLFLELVTMLAGQAELLLVGAEDLPAQPAEAKRMIDYLGVLEEKTAVHLSEDEAKLLSSVLYQLRTFYLQRK